MKHIHIFALGCLYFGSFVSLPFGLKAEGTKVVKVTFDAKDYQSDRDWKEFIEALCKTLKQHPDYGNPDNTFGVCIQNGTVLGTDPQSLSNYFKNYAERRQIGDVLSKISYLKADTERFSLLSLKRIFADATEIHLCNTETVTDSLEGCARKLNLFFHRSFRLENNLTWAQFVEYIRGEFGKYPDDSRVRFELNFRNGDVFGRDPGTINYGAWLDPKKKPTEITKILSKISRLTVDTKHFSTLSLSKIFPWTQALTLPNAESIYGASDGADSELKGEDCKTMRTVWTTYKKFVPNLQTVYAPKVTRIGNAAFFRFAHLQHFNAWGDFPIPERPAIVCTALPENYFAQKHAPANTRIAPVTVRKTIERYKQGKNKGEIKKTYYSCGGKTVEIGACAFQWCLSLQHVSAHASLIGSAAFAASGLKSAHFLLSKDAYVGDDVFFNCFELKECFMMLDRTDHGTVKSCFNGLFWNCFALETVCMPNIRYPHSNQSFGKPRKIDRPPAAYEEKSLTMFMNCFSLKNLDLRLFEKDYDKFLPYWIIRSNHELMVRERVEDWKNYLSGYFASDRIPSANIVRSEEIKERIKLCLPKEEKPKKDGQSVEKQNSKGKSKDSKNKKPFELIQAEGHCSKHKKCVYEKPYCDIKVIVNYCKNLKCVSGLDKKQLETWRETDGFSYNPGKTLYDSYDFPRTPAFRRFNDAYLQWFVTGEERDEDKPKNELLNKKTKRTNFVLHGG